MVRTSGFNINLISVSRSKELALDSFFKNELIKYKKTYEYVLPSFSSEKYTLMCEAKMVGESKIEIMEQNHQALKIVEVCNHKTLEFTNIYWSNKNGYFLKTIETLPKNGIRIEIDSVIS